MVDLKKYSFNKYSNKYNELFNKEKVKLEKIIPKVKIEHVGSTSIPGLGGKGIIDIAIKTPKNKLGQFIKKLSKLGYESNLEHPRTNNSVFLQKKIVSRGKERRVHIHLCLDENFYNSFIVVRDYLRNHDYELQNYARIKKKAIKYAKGEGKKYRAYKNPFLEKILKLALREYSK